MGANALGAERLGLLKGDIAAFKFDTVRKAASLALEAARTTREVLDEEVAAKNEELNELMGELINVGASECFFYHSTKPEWRKPSDFDRSIGVVGTFQGFQVFDRSELHEGPNFKEGDRLEVCVVVAIDRDSVGSTQGNILVPVRALDGPIY